MADYTLLDEYGNPRVIDESEVPDALAHGWRAESPEEAQARVDAETYGSREHTIAGTVEAGLRGATFGLSDLAMDRALAAIRGEGFAQQEAAKAAARRRALGGVGTAVEIAGAALPALATGGTGAVARGLAATPAGVASRVGMAAEGLAARALPAGLAEGSMLGRSLGAGVRLGAGGAAEGALMGGGGGISEAVLAGEGGDYGKLAEAWLAGAGGGAVGGALFGGALGMGGGAVASLAGKAGKRFAPTLEKFAEERAFKALSPRQGDVNRMLGEGPEAAARARLIGRSVLDNSMPSAFMKAEDLVPTTAASAKRAGKELGDFRERIYKAIDDEAAAASKTAGYRDKPALRDVDDEARAFFRRVDDEIAKPLTDGLAPASIVSRVKRMERELAPLRKRLDDETPITLRDLVEYRKRLDSVLRPKSKSGGLPSAPPAHAEQLEQARALLEETIENITEKTAVKIDPALAGQYKALKAAYGPAADAAKLARKGGLRDLRNRFVSPSDYGTGIGVVAGLIGSGGAILPALAKGAALSMVHKVLRERGSSTLAVTAFRLARSEELLSGSIKKYLSAGTRREAAIEGARPPKKLPAPKPRIPVPAMTATQYHERQKQLREMDPSTDPGIGQAAVEAPNTVTAVVETKARMRQYLIDNAPTDPLEGDPLQPHLKPKDPNPVALQQYARKWAAIDDPLGTIERGLESGTLTRDEVEAIKTVYPVTFQEIRSKVFAELAESKERLPYEKRVRLGMLFDIPADKSLRPDQIARTQALYKVTLPAEQAAQGPAAPAAAPQQLAQSRATPAQVIEGGMQEF